VPHSLSKQFFIVKIGSEKRFHNCALGHTALIALDWIYQKPMKGLNEIRFEIVILDLRDNLSGSGNNRAGFTRKMLVELFASVRGLNGVCESSNLSESIFD